MPSSSSPAYILDNPKLCNSIVFISFHFLLSTEHRSLSFLRLLPLPPQRIKKLDLLIAWHNHNAMLPLLTRDRLPIRPDFRRVPVQVIPAAHLHPDPPGPNHQRRAELRRPRADRQCPAPRFRRGQEQVTRQPGSEMDEPLILPPVLPARLPVWRQTPGQRLLQQAHLDRLASWAKQPQFLAHLHHRYRNNLKFFHLRLPPAHRPGD